MIGAFLLGALLAATSEPRAAIAPISSWANVGPDGGDVRMVAADPTDPDVAYAATAHGLYRTSDGGASWNPLPLDAELITSVAVDAAGAIVWCVSSETVVMTTISLTYEALHRSGDSGQTWTEPFSAASSNVAVATDPSETGTVYVSTLDYPDVGSFSKSTDGGATWTALAGPGAISISVSPDSAHVYAASWKTILGSQSAVYASADAGATWVATSLVSDAPLHVLADASRLGTVYAWGPTVYRSDDSGVTWKIRSPVSPPERPVAVAVDSLIPGRVYLATSTDAVFTSYDRGDTWTRAAALPSDVASLSSRLPSGVWGATDRGVFAAETTVLGWTPTNAGIRAAAVRAIAIAPSDKRVVYALASGFARSPDGGETWVSDPFAPLAGSVIAVDPVRSEHVYASSAGGGLLESEDAGTTWRTLPGPPGPVSSATVDPGDPSLLMATTFNSGGVGPAWRSTDGGVTWTQGVDPGPYVYFVIAGNGALWASTHDLFESLDGGASWAKVLSSEAMGGAVADSVAFDPLTGAVYVGTYNGILRSGDGGVTWTATSAIPAFGLIDAVYVACDRSGDVYAYAETSITANITSVGPPFASRDGGKSWFIVPNWDPDVGITSLPVGAAPGILIGTDRGALQKSLRSPRPLASR